MTNKSSGTPDMSSHDPEKRRKLLRMVARHSEAKVFSGNGMSELLVHLPPFATEQDRQEFSKVLFTLGDAIKQPFSQCAAAASPMSLKIHADDDRTLSRLTSVKNTLNHQGIDDLELILAEKEECSL